MEDLTSFSENFELLPDHVSLDSHYMFTSEIFHTLHLQISNPIMKFKRSYLSSEDIMFHPVSPCWKHKIMYSYSMPSFSA